MYCLATMDSIFSDPPVIYNFLAYMLSATHFTWALSAGLHTERLADG